MDGSNKSPGFVIEADVPLPAKDSVASKYPLADMKVGDSFFIPDGRRDHISSAVTYVQRRMNRKYSMRKVDGGLRVWRVA